MRFNFFTLVVLSAIICFSFIACGNKNFAGDYIFLVPHKKSVTNPYVKETYSWFGQTKTKESQSTIIALLPIKLKIVKEGKEYKGQLLMNRFNQNMFGFDYDDTTEIYFEMKNFLTSGDTLNFSMSATSVLGHSDIRGFLIKGNTNMLGISKNLIDEPECYELNPAFVKKDGQMFVFKELKSNNVEAEKQMIPAYRSCLSEKKGQEKAIMYIDSVILRKDISK
jgi:hypothetical protein